LSQYSGKNDIEKMRRVFATVLQFTAAIMLVISTFVFFFPILTMRIFTNVPEVIEQGAGYIKIIALSYFIFALSDTLIAMFRTSEIVRIGILVSFVALFTNLIFNYIFIFGKFGVPAMGIKGAALATLLARSIEFIIVLIYTLCIDKKIKLTLKNLFTFDKKMQKDFIKYGIPVVIGDSQWGFIGFIKAMMIGRLGVMMVAANSIADVVLSLALIFTNGLTSGACVTVGKAVGAGDNKKAREYSNTIQILFACVGVCVATLVFFTRFFPPMLYNVSAQTKALASTFLAIGAFTHIGTCYHAACFVGINRGAGDGKFVMKVDMICGWLVVLPLTFISAFVLHLPLPAVYLCTRIDQCYKWIIAFFRLRGNKWIKNVTQTD
ncbi:MAG: MATE family efflux transporter, partial [Christensenellaceae bacterium]